MATNRETILRDKFNGDEAAYIAWMKEIGAKGGRKKVKKGFALWGKEELQVIGGQGGRKSRRGKKGE
jgi:hypothetical protein